MNYISLDNLTRYHSKFKDYADTKYTLASDYGWKQTEKAGAVTCWPVGESRMKPVVEFLFKETLPVGDKSSQNPSTITGVTSINVGRISKNQLLKLSSFNWAGLDVTANVDGSYTFNGTITLSAFSARAFTDSASTYSGVKSSVHLDKTKNYTISCELVSGSVSLSNPDGNKPGFVYGCADNSANSIGIALPLSVGKNSIFSQAKVNDAGKFIARVQMFQTTTFTNAVYKFQLEEGSTATDFEASILPANANNTISLGSTYYGGILDVSTGKLTVTHRMIEVDSLTLDISNYPAYLPLECTDTFGRTITSTGNILALTGSTGGKIVYKLANPYTVQIDPVAITSLPQIDKYTPRLNTLYTDAENITVKYIKSPIRDEYEKVQAIIANGGTI